MREGILPGFLSPQPHYKLQLTLVLWRAKGWAGVRSVRGGLLAGAAAETPVLTPNLQYNMMTKILLWRATSAEKGGGAWCAGRDPTRSVRRKPPKLQYKRSLKFLNGEPSFTETGRSDPHSKVDLTPIVRGRSDPHSKRATKWLPKWLGCEPRLNSCERRGQLARRHARPVPRTPPRPPGASRATRARAMDLKAVN